MNKIFLPNKTKTLLALFTLLFLSLTSCKTTLNIPDNASATQLIQMGQDAMELMNYKNSRIYYETVIQRYGMNIALYIEARYEMGHLFLRQKKYSDAYIAFQEILEIFENAEYGTVPQAYKKLAIIGMNAIPDKVKQKIEKDFSKEKE